MNNQNSQKEFHLLLVDAEKINLNVLVHILEPYYNISVAKSGEKAYKHATKYLPDLILLDVLLPDISGFDVLVKLQANDATRHIPVIFVTGLDSAKDEEKGFRLGAVDYIKKPFNNIVVKARVQTQIKLVKQMRAVEKLGLIDPLTNLANRRSFDYNMNIEWEKSQTEFTPISMLMIDIDNFKYFNDTYGHPQGDILLQNIAQNLTQILTGSNSIWARIGGEEFAVILPDCNELEAWKIAEEVCSGLAHSHIILGSTIQQNIASVTVSIGTSTMNPTLLDNSSELIKQADTALYAAKNRGKNQVCSFRQTKTKDS